MVVPLPHGEGYNLIEIFHMNGIVIIFAVSCILMKFDRDFYWDWDEDTIEWLMKEKWCKLWGVILDESTIQNGGARWLIWIGTARVKCMLRITDLRWEALLIIDLWIPLPIYQQCWNCITTNLVRYQIITFTDVLLLSFGQNMDESNVKIRTFFLTRDCIC